MLKKSLALIAAGTVLCGFSASAADYYGTLQKIKESGTIVLGHRESSVPFAYIGPDQKPIGYSMDLCAKIVEAVKAELKLEKLNVKYVPVTPQTRIPLIANGNINIECGSTTNTLTRQQQVDFAYTTYLTGTKLLVKKSSGIKEVEDLKGKAIALAQGTTNERAIKEAIAKLKIADVKIQNVKDHAEGFLALETDRVDAYSTDDIQLYGLIAKAKNPADYAVVGRFLSFDPYALMLSRDDSAFRLLVNKTLAALFRTGEIEQLYTKWFMSPIPGGTALNVPMDGTLKTNFMVQAFPE
ncbi:amino acid ABC transporter substrate-binding protein [Shumkonia mesophila]|uniref:amino acid ABC transporter substrate-binding protein n=1 Tax=Shumkonia mesophila TaxID=2838854 RepID=UPI002934E91F|nr:amino acid ABC transporter substrate-binding protein [Shumkonia mesophila]